MYNLFMTDFQFHTPITVHYSDLDTQWHVNNAHFFSFIEQARVSYLVELGLFKGQNFLDFPIIVADAHMTYRQPIPFGATVDVGVAVTKIGNKSLTFEYSILDPAHEKVYATAETIMVMFDYRKNVTMAVPQDWRERISGFEGKAF